VEGKAQGLPLVVERGFSIITIRALYSMSIGNAGTADHLLLLLLELIITTRDRECWYCRPSLASRSRFRGKENVKVCVSV
jgi:hypothetical protein